LAFKYLTGVKVFIPALSLYKQTALFANKTACVKTIVSRFQFLGALTSVRVVVTLTQTSIARSLYFGKIVTELFVTYLNAMLMNGDNATKIPETFSARASFGV